MGLWRDVPRADNTFTNNLMQAVSTVAADEHYDSSLLEWSKTQIAAAVADCLPASAVKRSILSGLRTCCSWRSTDFRSTRILRRTAPVIQPW